MTIDEAYKVCCEVVGELSFAVIRGKGSKAKMISWIKRLRAVADALELKTGKVDG